MSKEDGVLVETKRGLHQAGPSERGNPHKKEGRGKGTGNLSLHKPEEECLNKGIVIHGRFCQGFA